MDLRNLIRGIKEQVEESYLNSGHVVEVKSIYDIEKSKCTFLVTCSCCNKVSKIEIGLAKNLAVC